MKVNAFLTVAVALVAAGAWGPSAAADHWLPNCPHPSPHSHSYLAGGSVLARSDALSTGDLGAGFALVLDMNVVDCDGDFDPLGPDTETGDFDGDYELGIGGAFFGFGPWAHEPVCDFRLTPHGATATVNDVVHGGNVALVIGVDDQNGPDLTPDPVSGEPACSTSGSITPGDPNTDPTADADDCLTAPGTGSVTTCGAGGDGGYWVFLGGLLIAEEGGSGTLLCTLPEPELAAVNEAVNSVAGGELLPICLGNPGSVSATNSPTSGTVTA